MSGRVVSNVHSVDVGWGQEKEVFLAGDDGVEILVMVFMERGFGMMIPDP